MHFADLLAQAIARVGSPVCVGIDPDWSQLPEAVKAGRDPKIDARPFSEFARGVIDQVAPFAAAVKFQSACYEMYGEPGLIALHDGLAYAKQRGLVAILDAKRGDIGITADRYAHAAFVTLGAEALTVSPYLGEDTITPFLKQPDRGVFVLVRTSNPGSDTVQSHRLQSGDTVAEMVARMVARLGASRRGECGLSDVGAVVAATKPQDAARLRALMPETIFLIPGYGAQGGRAEDLAAMRRAGQKPETQGILVTSSRAIIYAKPEAGESDWRLAVGRAASRFNAEIRG